MAISQFHWPFWTRLIGGIGSKKKADSSQSGTILTSSFLSIGPSRLDFGPRYADGNDRCASSRSASPSQLVAWQKWLVFQSRAPHEVLILIGALIAPAGKITSVGGADYVYVADSVGQELRYQVTPE